MTNNISHFSFTYNNTIITMNLYKDHEYISNQIKTLSSFYEIDLLNELQRLPIPAGKFCDIGANIGNHTIFFATIMNRSVFAFEPVPENHKLLTANIELNHLSEQVKTFQTAVGKSSGKGEMVVNEDNMGASHFLQRSNGNTQLATLDSLIGDNETIAAIKIDVEGFELDVLIGAKQTLERCSPLLIVEAGTDYSYKQVASLIGPMGYFPIGMKGKTRTYFFIHESVQNIYSQLGLFLTRLDLDTMSRHQKSQADRILRSIEMLPSQKAIQKTTSTSSAKILNALEPQFSELGVELCRLHTSIESKTSVKEISSQLSNIASKVELASHELQNFSSVRIERDAAMSKVMQLELECRRLRLSIYTERARCRFTSRRLKHLYQSGPRGFVGKLRKFAAILTSGLIKPYESWREFEKRVEARASRELDDFRKLHAMQHQRTLRNFTPQNESMVQYRSNTKPQLLGVEQPRVRIGIASIAIRSDALSYVIDCLYDQADEFIIYLNDYSNIPEFLKRDKIVAIHGKEDVGDRGKFYDIENFEGYMFTCDDDIHYPQYYVQHCISAIEQFGRKAVVGWHGSTLLAPFKDYYTAKSRRVYSFRSGRPVDTPVHILGTGCAAFHTKTIRVSFSDFKEPNIADVYFALLGQQQSVPFVVIKHDQGEAFPLEIPEDKPIHRESMQRTGSKADTRLLQNNLVSNRGEWVVKSPNSVFKRDSMTIAYVGRLNVDRWKKGGILKSGHLILEALRSLGHRLIPVEISCSIAELTEAVREAEIVWIYPGDPDRPDFSPVEELIVSSAKNGKTVFVNLSYNQAPARTAWIANRLEQWKKQFGPLINACVFTYTALQDPALASVRSNLVCLPKSIEFTTGLTAEFDETEGIFLGDLQKLLNRDLVGGNIESWIAALRAKLPDVKLYAVRQYGGEIDRDLGLELIPFASGPTWEDWITARRIVCCLTPHATFEMIPVEAAGSGVPIIYRSMPHAHTETLSVTGVQADTPEKFAGACSILYNDPIIWKLYSQSSQFRAKSQSINLMKSAIHTNMIISKL